MSNSTVYAPTSVNTYGDISPRTAAFAASELLKRGDPLLVFERYGQAKPLPKNSTQTIKFRRYEALPLATTPLTEGVTPTGSNLTKTDVTAVLRQYGDFVAVTDVIQDTHEDPILRETMQLCGEQAAQTLEMVRYGVLNAGTNVFRAGGATTRSDITSGLTIGLQRKIVNALQRQLAGRITRIVTASPNFGTEPIAPAYIAVCHVDLETTIRKMPGFVPVEKYSDAMKAQPGEIGKVESVRYIGTTMALPFTDAGGAVSSGDLMSTGGSNADVYPILYFGKDAYGLVPLKGNNAVTPMVLNPNSPRGGDPLGQRGSIGWKAYSTAVILNELWMARAEVAVSTNFEDA